MSERYDVLTVREKDGKSYFTRLGAMFPNRAGDGFTVLLDAMPASFDGQYRLIVRPPQDRQQSRGNDRRPADDMDEPPF